MYQAATVPVLNIKKQIYLFTCVILTTQYSYVTIILWFYLF